MPVNASKMIAWNPVAKFFHLSEIATKFATTAIRNVQLGNEGICNTPNPLVQNEFH